MGTCSGKGQKQENQLKDLNKLINELLNARKNVFKYLNVSYKMEKQLNKIDAKTDMQLIQKYMGHYEGQYDYQSFINCFDLLTQTIQLSKNVLQNISNNYGQIKNEKFQSQIDFLNQYLSSFVLETCEDFETDEGNVQENNMPSLEHIQEYEKEVQNIESLKKLPQEQRGQQSLNQIKRNSNQQFSKQISNSKSLSDPNTASNLKEDQALSTQRKTVESLKSNFKQPHLNSYPEFIEYKKNNSNPNFQNYPQNQKSFTVLIVDGQIKIQQSQQKFDLDISDSLIY